ncbi:MAG: carboxyvinyl-carboxyphosphonate phosphorylmutase [Comamonadaceae bacterium]|nr:MAG: carboxyvinyl-carboxyphosphonate phosphorylmutase [Comamonadaceae bacterium]
MKAAARLRELLAQPDMVVAPGSYDAITARLIEQAGFAAVYMTGAGTSAARGYPDFGLLTMTEMVENAGVIARCVSIPLIADADTGYGNELNVTRTVREYEARNVAAIHIEDQVSPKRCGHLDGKEVIDRGAYIAKIRAAVAARESPDFVIIARTDARAVVSFDEAVDRANAALDAGADIAFVEAVQTIEEIEAVPKRVHGACMLNVVPGGKTPLLNLHDIQQMGYRLTILPGILLRATIEACDKTLKALKDTNMPAPANSGATVSDTFRRFGADEWNDLRKRFQDA